MDKPIKHDTGSVMILSDGSPRRALLLHHRKLGKWMWPGGHVEAYEHPLEAAIRETEEESGLDVAAYLPALTVYDDHVDQLPLPNYLFQERIEAHKAEAEHYHIDHIYVARVPQQEFQHNQAESHDIGWFTLEEIEQLPLFENVRTLLRQEMTA